MTPVQPEELSALLDGELDPQRAAEVERQIAADAELKAAFDALRHADQQWRLQAQTAAFTPHVSPARTQFGLGGALGLGVAAILVAVRLGVRGIDAAAVAYGLQAVVLVAILAATAMLSFPRPERLNLR